MKRLIILLHFILLGQLAIGQTYAVVGTSLSANTSTSYPALYGSLQPGAKHQFFYKASELSAGGLSANDLVVSVGFNVLSASGTTCQAISISVYTTSAPDPLSAGFVTTGLVATSTVVNYLPVPGWNQHAIKPFAWNGTDHLIVQVCYSGSITSQNHQVYQTLNTGTIITSRYATTQGLGACFLTSNTASAYRSDVRFEIGPACSSTPGTNTLYTLSNSICYGTSVTLPLLASYSVTGLNYQWLNSTVSTSGPYTVMASGPLLSSYTTPTLAVNNWYVVLVSCPGHGTISTNASAVIVTSPSVATVPYFESFETLLNDNELPNCKWYSSDLSNGTRTSLTPWGNNRNPRTGTRYAYFSNTGPDTNYYYNSPMQLYAGVTYSAGLWYKTDSTAFSNWHDLTISVESTPVPTVKKVIRSVNGSAYSNAYKLLSDTFSIPQNGTYSLRISVTNTANTTEYLTWDDLFVTLPCKFNVPPVTAQANPTVVCIGHTVNVSASGANTYTWSNDSTTSMIVGTPSVNIIYTVTGKSNLTNCTGTSQVFVKVSAIPSISIFPVYTVACRNAPVTLYGYGGTSYAWSSGGTNAIDIVKTSSLTTYTVIGYNGDLCSASATASVDVLPQPTITAHASATQVCVGDAVNVTGNGGYFYEWKQVSTNQVTYGGDVFVSLSPPGTGVLLLTGIDANGCSGGDTLLFQVDACLGVEAFDHVGLNVYPNPGSGVFHITGESSGGHEWQVSEIAGRILKIIQTGEFPVDLDLTDLPPGVYMLRDKRSGETLKLIRQ